MSDNNSNDKISNFPFCILKVISECFSPVSSSENMLQFCESTCITQLVLPFVQTVKTPFPRIFIEIDFVSDKSKYLYATIVFFVRCVKYRSSFPLAIIGIFLKFPFPPCGIFPFVKLQQIPAGYSPFPCKSPPFNPQDVISTCGIVPSGNI